MTPADCWNAFTCRHLLSRDPHGSQRAAPRGDSLMARWPRIVLAGAPLHVVQRGNNRSATFVTNDDYAHYREILRDAAERTACLLHAYVFMTNHVHLLVTPSDLGGASRLIQCVGRRYVRYFNARYGRSGTLWEGRFKSSVVDTTNYYLACSRYIDLNPVRAGMVASPSEYRWSSYRHLASGEPDDAVVPHAAYTAMGSTPEDRQRSYTALCAHALSRESLRAIRVALHGGSVLGGARFRTKVQRITQRKVSRLSHGGDRRSSSFLAPGAS